MPAGSGGAQETVGCGNIRAVEQWKPCVGAVKKKPLRERRGDRVTWPHLPAQFNTNTSKREGKTAGSMCTIHRNPGISVCVYVCELLCLYVCVPTAESC